MNKTDWMKAVPVFMKTVSPPEQRILDYLLSNGPAPKKHIAAALNMVYLTPEEHLTALSRAQRVMVLGRCDELGFKNVAANARVYAHPQNTEIRKPEPKKKRDPNEIADGAYRIPTPRRGPSLRWGGLH